MQTSICWWAFATSTKRKVVTVNTKRLALMGLTALALLTPSAAQAAIDEVRVFTKGYL